MTWREAIQVTETFPNMREATEAFAFNVVSTGFIGGYLTTRHCPNGQIRLCAFYSSTSAERYWPLPDGCRWIMLPTPRADLGVPQDASTRYACGLARNTTKERRSERHDP